MLRDSWLFPRHIATVHIRAALRAARERAHGTLIDVGCGQRPYQALFNGRVNRYVGIDWPPAIRQTRADVFGDAQALPIRSACADTVLALELIEHLPDAPAFLREAHRVLRPGGTLMLSAPFMEALHEEPRDFLRYTPHALRAILAAAGFHADSVAARGGWWSVVLGGFVPQVIYDTLNPERGGRRGRGIGFLVALPLCAVAQWVAWVLDKVTPSRRFTLGWVVIATRLESVA